MLPFLSERSTGIRAVTQGWLPESPPQLFTALKVVLMGFLGEGKWFQVQTSGGTFIKVQLVSSFHDFSESLM